MATTNKSASKSAAEARRAAASAKLSAAKAKIAPATTPGAGFLNFVREQGVVGLAVGLAIGTAAGASVKTIVDQVISPIVALVTQGVDLNSLKWVIEQKTATHAQVAIGWGTIISSLITLFTTALVVYLVVHFAKLDRLDKAKDK